MPVTAAVIRTPLEGAEDGAQRKTPTEAAAAVAAMSVTTAVMKMAPAMVAAPAAVKATAVAAVAAVAAVTSMAAAVTASMMTTPAVTMGRQRFSGRRHRTGEGEDRHSDDQRA